MSQQLAGKTAVITGGTTGIGFATAKRFIAEGARVIITGQNEERVQAAAEKLGSAAKAVKADVRSLADLDTLAAAVQENFDGKLDIVFANAGIGYFSPLADTDEKFFDNMFDINVKGVYFTVQKLLPFMGKGGSIILTASAVHGKGVPTGSVYFASKAAVRSFARTLGAELAQQGIRVNSLSPGLVHTEFQSKLDMPKEAFDGFIDMVVKSAPLGRAGEQDEIANAATFLASDQSSYTTAADILVDGGWMNV